MLYALLLYFLSRHETNDIIGAFKIAMLHLKVTVRKASVAGGSFQLMRQKRPFVNVQELFKRGLEILFYKFKTLHPISLMRLTQNDGQK